MSILGDAIGRRLLGLSGRTQVEFPAQMEGAAVAAVAAINAASPGKAVMIVAEGAPDGDFTCTPGEALAWRTDHDRVFVWIRGDFDPDTSFTSAVDPFLTRDFPDGCRCGLDLLADLGTEALVALAGDRADPGARQNFMELGRAALAFAAGALADLPDTPNEPPMLALVRHWDTALDGVAAALAATERPLRPSDAMELFRALGLPAPEAAFNGSALRGERIFPDGTAAADAGRLWAEFCTESLGDRAAREQFQARLHGYAQDKGLPAAPWAGLDWTLEDPSSTPFEAVRNTLSRADGPLTSEHVPERPENDRAWWGLSASEARQVAGAGGDWTWRPLAGGQAASCLDGSIVVLRTEFAEVEGGTAGTALVLDNVEFELCAPSGAIHVQAEEPGDAASGDFWVQPAPLVVKAQRFRVSNATVRADGARAVVAFALRAPVPAATGQPHNWNPLTQLTAAFQARERHGAGWLAPRPVRLVAKALAPSPFSPTAYTAQEKGNRFVAAFPTNETAFEYAAEAGWTVSDTRDLPLPARGRVATLLYRAVLGSPTARTLSASGEADLKGLHLAEGDFGPVEGVLPLHDGDALLWRGAEAVTFHSSDTDTQAASGLLRAMNREDGLGQIEAPTAAFEELRGHYELELAAHVRAVVLGSAGVGLGQLLVATDGAVSPNGRAPGFNVANFLQWIGRGDVTPFKDPAWARVQGLPSYPAFQAAAAQVMAGYLAAAGDLPLVSSWGYGGITAEAVSQYCAAHTGLVHDALALGPFDRLLARFPYSIISMERRALRPDLRVAAVLLSPLHPARLAWAWSVAHAAISTTEAQLPAKLLGLSEGWNIPGSSAVPNSVEGEDLAVAQPVDNGADAVFAAWSGLVATVDGQCAPPSTACGLPMPWAGQTGVTQGALASALADYKLVHPFGETLSIALDALQAVPRSLAIDDAVLRLLGGEHHPRYSFPGGVEVWDSRSRLGDPPSRQQLLARRRAPGPYPSFTWRCVDDRGLPDRVDVRIFEAIETTTSFGPSEGLGAWSALPLRRFASTRFEPATGWLARDSAISPSIGDPLGLASLMRALEFTSGGAPTAVRTKMPDALGRENNASRWTVLGDLHLHPSVLSEYAERGMGQLLWEWRTGWLGVGKDRTPGERPYYVTSEVPASFKHGLAARQGLSTAQVAEVLADLGRRGVGLASLFNGGAPRERGAMGFFYAFRLLFPPVQGVALGADWLRDGESHALLPLDAVNSILEAMAGPSQPQVLARNRADFVLLILRKDGDRLGVTAVPIEVKHRGTPSNPAPLSTTDKAHAQQQVKATRELLANMAKSLSDPAAPPAATLARRNALALLMELGLGLSPRPESPDVAAGLMQAALWGKVEFNVANGAIFTFNPGGHGSLLPISPYSVSTSDTVLELLMDPCALPGMFWQGSAPEAVEGSARADLDRAFRRMVDGATTFGATPAVAATLPSVGEGPPIDPEAGQDGPVEPRTPEPSGGGAAEPVASASGTPEPATPALEPVDTAEPVRAREVAEGTALPSASGDASLAAAPQGAEPVAPQPPQVFIGASAVGKRWAIIGRNERNQTVGFDLEQVHATGVFGYMGSGKSYFLNTLIEGAVAPLPGLNELPQPLAVVVFNYRQSASDRFEYTSLCSPNDQASDVEKLATFGAAPAGIPNLQILALPGQLTERRLAEYGPASASELLFNPATLSLEDWMLLMGEPGHQRVYAQTITSVLRELEREGRPVTLEALAEALAADDIAPASRRSGELRLRFLQPYVSDTAATDFRKLVRPGATTVIDLRASLFDKHDALRFFLICANQIGQLRGFNKLVVFDEAHEYMSSEFEDKISSRIRNLRHEGASYIFATQDVASLPPGILKFLDTAFVFGMGTARNQADLAAAFAPMRELGDRVLKVEKGQCYAWAQSSASDLFSVPRRVFVRPRVSRHGGGTQTFLGPR